VRRDGGLGLHSLLSDGHLTVGWSKTQASLVSILLHTFAVEIVFGLDTGMPTACAKAWNSRKPAGVDGMAGTGANECTSIAARP
jgi:hypothetical protein